MRVHERGNTLLRKSCKWLQNKCIFWSACDPGEGPVGLYCRTLCVICTPHLLCTPQGMLSPPEVSHSHHTHFPREGGEGGEGDFRENETYRSSPLFPSSPIVPYTFPTPHTPSYGTFSPHTTLSEPSLPPLYSCAPPPSRGGRILYLIEHLIK